MTDPTDPTAEGRPLSALDSWARMLAGAEVLAGRALLPFDQLPAGEQERHRVVARRLVEAAVVEAAPASPAPATDRTALRRIVFGAVESVFEAWRDGLGDCRPEDALTDAVLAVLPAPTDRAAVLNEAADAIDHETQQLKDHEVLEPDRYRPCRDASAQLRRMADETRQAEDPARVNRLRPEFFEHASVEAIDSQIRRAQTHQRAWGDRERTLGNLRQARVKQKELGEWPAAGAQQPKETSNPRTVCVCGHTKGEHLTVSGRLLCDACDPDSTDNLVCRGFDAL